MKITTNEILDALQAAAASAPPSDHGARTLTEIRNETGWGEDQAKQRLKELKTGGLLEVVKVQRESLDGRRVMVPAYRLTPKKKGR
jgi:hypothetical protein